MMNSTQVPLTSAEVLKTLQVMNVFKVVARNQYFEDDMEEEHSRKLLEDVAIVDSLMDAVLARTWTVVEEKHDLNLDLKEKYGVWLVLDNYRQFLLETEQYELMKEHIELMCKFRPKEEL